MERFKRTFTLRKKKPTSKALLDSNTKPSQWNDDEKKVREGCCSFQVKYLGSIEVFESRGMPVCEEAMKQLLKYKSKKKSKRAILYVSGDALRVTEEISKGLIVDQVIEKVSFCAPDRNHKRGFAYICRDATTRRWLCHGFKAVKESGERLSHAVGCAFAVCLEKKQQREKDSVDVTFNENKTSFTRLGSFKQATITERRLDPQSVIIAEPVSGSNNANSTNNSVPTPSSIPRPHASQSVLDRQNSMKIFPKLQEQNNPFKRDHSVRITDLSSNQERKNMWNTAAAVIKEEVSETKDEPKTMTTTSESINKIPIESTTPVDPVPSNGNKEPDFTNLFSDDPFSAAPINPAVHIKHNFVNESNNQTPFSSTSAYQYSMRAPHSEKLYPGPNTNLWNNTNGSNSTNNNFWPTQNQYKSFNGKLSTTWSDDILRPTHVDHELNDKHFQLCANSVQKNPFDVTWVRSPPNISTNINNNNNNNINKTSSNHNTNPFKT